MDGPRRMLMPITILFVGIFTQHELPFAERTLRVRHSHQTSNRICRSNIIMVPTVTVATRMERALIATSWLGCLCRCGIHKQHEQKKKPYAHKACFRSVGAPKRPYVSCIFVCTEWTQHSLTFACVSHYAYFVALVTEAACEMLNKISNPAWKRNAW